MRAAGVAIAALDQGSIQSILDGATLTLEVEGANVELDADKVFVERLEKAALRVLNEGTLTVALDTEITEELHKEGLVRDLVRGVQNLRKESGLEVTDRIVLTVGGAASLRAAFELFADFAASETLAVETRWEDSLSGGTEIEAGEAAWRVKVAKAG
jgi:isoleucyl-tRNA synthetase